MTDNTALPSRSAQASVPNPRSPTEPLKIFATVGTTRFDALVEALFTPLCLSQQASLGVKSLTLQHGTSELPECASALCTTHKITLTSFPYAPDIGEYMRSADIIISHGGAGSLLEALALEKRVVAVINRTLMDDHQQELALALQSANCLISTDVAELSDALSRAARAEFSALPPRNRNVLPGVIAQEIAML